MKRADLLRGLASLPVAGPLVATFVRPAATIELDAEQWMTANGGTDGIVRMVLYAPGRAPWLRYSWTANKVTLESIREAHEQLTRVAEGSGLRVTTCRMFNGAALHQFLHMVGTQ